MTVGWILCLKNQYFRHVALFWRHGSVANKLGINTLADGGCQLFWDFFARMEKSCAGGRMCGVDYSAQREP
jgi:hypothetical protein